MGLDWPQKGVVLLSFKSILLSALIGSVSFLPNIAVGDDVKGASSQKAGVELAGKSLFASQSMRTDVSGVAVVGDELASLYRQDNKLFFKRGDLPATGHDGTRMALPMR